MLLYTGSQRERWFHSQVGKAEDCNSSIIGSSPVGTSIIKCPGGEIGRRTGLKILRTLKSVPVRLRPRAPFLIKKKNEKKVKKDLQKFKKYVNINKPLRNALVAQLDRVLDYGSRGCGFDSCLARHLFELTYMIGK